MNSILLELDGKVCDYTSIFKKYPKFINEKFHIIELKFTETLNEIPHAFVTVHKIIGMCKSRLIQDTGQLWIQTLSVQDMEQFQSDFKELDLLIHKSRKEILVLECGHVHLLSSFCCCHETITENTTSREDMVNMYKNFIKKREEHSQKLVKEWISILPASIKIHARPMNDCIRHISHSFLHALNTVSENKLQLGMSLTRQQKIPSEKNNQNVTLTFSHIRYHNCVADVPTRFLECNTEQICGTTLKEGRFTNLTNWLLKPSSFLIEYSSENIKHLQQHVLQKEDSNQRIQLVPFYPSLVLKSFVNFTTDVSNCAYDVVFLGSRSTRRTQILDACTVLGLKVLCPVKSNMTFSEQLNYYKSGCVVLNIHWADDSSILELARFIPALCAGRCIITETSQLQDGFDTLCKLPGVFMVNHNTMAQFSHYVIKNLGDNILKTLAQHNIDAFKTSYNLETFLKTFPELSLVSSNWKNLGFQTDTTLVDLKCNPNVLKPKPVTKPLAKLNPNKSKERAKTILAQKFKKK